MFRSRLEQFGDLQFLENHYIEKNDIIVKYSKLEDSKLAFDSLNTEFEIHYVPSKIDSDRNNNYQHVITSESKDHDATRSATITLNMLKLKNLNEYYAGNIESTP